RRRALCPPSRSPGTPTGAGRRARFQVRHGHPGTQQFHTRGQPYSTDERFLTFARRALVRCRHGSAVVPVTGRAASLQGVPDPFEVIAFLLIAAVPVLVGLLIAGIARAVANRLPASPVVEFLPPQEGSIF